jgi:hypothetical protein
VISIKRISRIVALIAVLAFVVLAVKGLSLVITQTAPATSPPLVTTTCNTLTLSQPITPNGSSGTEVMTCGTNAAFTVALGTVTPSFNLVNSGYSNLGIVVHNQPCSGATTITSGTAVTFNQGNSYDYCGDYTNVQGGLSTLVITWSQ